MPNPTASLRPALVFHSKLHVGSASTSMNLMSASQASLSSTNALHAHVSGSAFHPHRDRFQQQLIARNHGLPHLYLIHAEQHGKLAGVLQLLAQQQSTELCHRFDDQHARHDRRAGVVALEENVVKSDVFDPRRLWCRPRSPARDRPSASDTDAAKSAGSAGCPSPHRDAPAIGVGRPGLLRAVCRASI